jgi:hypothetical protein
VFEEPLVYLFYGRPAYRSRRGATPDTSIQLCPVCFIFKSALIPTEPARIYPFDTGAAKQGRFAPHVQATDTEAFALHPTLTCVQRFVRTFFETNGNYFLGRPSKVLNLPPGGSAAASYFSLISTAGPADYDDRRSAVEFQYRAQIPLAGFLWAVVLPIPFLEDNDIRRTLLSKWGAFPLPYSVVQGTSPAEYSAAVRMVYERWLREGGMI